MRRFWLYSLAVLRLIGRLGLELGKFVGYIVGVAACAALVPLVIVTAFVGLHLYLVIALIVVTLGAVVTAAGLVPRRK